MKTSSVTFLTICIFFSIFFLFFSRWRLTQPLGITLYPWGHHFNRSLRSILVKTVIHSLAHPSHRPIRPACHLRRTFHPTWQQQTNISPLTVNRHFPLRILHLCRQHHPLPPIPVHRYLLPTPSRPVIRVAVTHRKSFLQTDEATASLHWEWKQKNTVLPWEWLEPIDKSKAFDRKLTWFQLYI